MLQIKTIYKDSASVFDEEVNKALTEGWTLTRRAFDDRGFLAELEREIITEAEKSCGNCKYHALPPESEPCRSCSDDCDKWEPAT